MQCKDCPNNSECTYFCDDCNKGRCSECDALYHRHPKRKVHNRTPIEVQSVKDQNLSKVQCVTCKREKPTSFCENCDKSRCDRCDAKFHSHAKRQTHKRNPITVETEPDPEPESMDVSYHSTEENIPSMESFDGPTNSIPKDVAFPSLPRLRASDSFTFQLGNSTNQMPSSMTSESPDGVAFSQPPPAAMRFCFQCGTELFPNAQFCHGCGMNLAQFLNRVQNTTISNQGHCPSRIETEFFTPPDSPSSTLNRPSRTSSTTAPVVKEIQSSISKQSNKNIGDEVVKRIKNNFNGDQTVPIEDWLIVCDSKFEEPNVEIFSNLISLLTDMVKQMPCVFAISKEEARNSLIDAKFDLEKAAKMAICRRKRLVSKIKKQGFDVEKDIHESLYQHGGSFKKASIQIPINILSESLFERMWTSSPLENTFADSNSELLVHKPQYMYRIENKIQQGTVDRERCHRMIACEASLKWSQVMLVYSLVTKKHEIMAAKEAATNCTDINRATEFLSISCQICYEDFPKTWMIDLPYCTNCNVCRVCMIDYIKNQLLEFASVSQLNCPVCCKPDANDSQPYLGYLQLLSVQLKDLLDSKLYDLYQSKVLDMSLMKNEKFRWCTNCPNYGFIYEGENDMMTCDKCHKKTCFSCKKEWKDQHGGLTCKEFEEWELANNPEYQENKMDAYLKVKGITCPNCKIRYELAKGGCLHFKCFKCSYEFCGACSFKFSRDCTNFKDCHKKGLHAHHPRNCYYYLRNFDIAALQKLLQDNEEEFRTENPEDMTTCKVLITNANDDNANITDLICNKEIEENQGGYCHDHYIEYLVLLINEKNLDPVNIFEENHCMAEFARNDLEFVEGTPLENMIAEIKEKVPLHKMT